MSEDCTGCGGLKPAGHYRVKCPMVRSRRYSTLLESSLLHMRKSAPQIQAMISKLDTIEAMRLVIDRAPEAMRGRLKRHGLAVLAMKKKRV